MGNCQAMDSAALVIQHPSGKLERRFEEIIVSDVMKMNPGHYVSLIILFPDSTNEAQQLDSSKEMEKQRSTVGYTRVKLLQPSDTLVLGQAYRLVTIQEVMRVVQAKKKARMKNREVQESAKKSCCDHGQKKNSTGPATTKKQDKTESSQITMERDQARTVQMNTVAIGRIKSWRPSLQSISEAGS